jgi:hypothetical protein
MYARRDPDGSLAATLRGLVGACLIVLSTAVPAGAMDRITLTYGLREYLEFSDNLFFASDDQDKVRDAALNTAPDLSILHDDGETRWLVRGSYRRESFIDNREASGDYYALSGEISRALSNRVTFSLLGGYTRSSSIVLGRVGEEPGQRDVVRPSRGSLNKATFWSPSLTVFWSRKFRTDLTYENNQSFTGGSVNSIDRSLTLSAIYGLSARTFLQASVTGLTNRSSGQPDADMQDSNVFATRVGFSHVFSPRLTMDITGGPIWTKNVNFPDRVTLIRNALVKECSFFGLTCEQAFLREPDQKVEDISMSLGLNLGVEYQPDHKTTIGLSVTRDTSSGEGVSGTQQTDVIRVVVGRRFRPRWLLSVAGTYSLRSSVLDELAILSTKDPDTGQQEALDRSSFDLPKSVDQTEITLESAVAYRINRYLNAFSSWRWTKQRSKGEGDVSIMDNRVILGVEFRGEEHF